MHVGELSPDSFMKLDQARTRTIRAYLSKVYLALILLLESEWPVRENHANDLNQLSSLDASFDFRAMAERLGSLCIRSLSNLDLISAPARNVTWTSYTIFPTGVAYLRTIWLARSRYCTKRQRSDYGIRITMERAWEFFRDRGRWTSACCPPNL